jgi:deoxyhypusine synthase
MGREALFEKHPQARGYLRPRAGYELLSRRAELIEKLLSDVRRDAQRMRDGSRYPLAPLAQNRQRPPTKTAPQRGAE